MKKQVPTRRVKMTILSQLVLLTVVGTASADQTAMDAAKKQQIEHGEWLIRNRPFFIPFAKVEDFKKLWMVWEDKSEQDAVKGLKDGDLLTAIGKHYGLSKADYDNNGLPLGFMQAEIKDPTTGAPAKYTFLNCYACHSSRIDNQMVWGAWNPKFDFQMIAVDNLRLAEKGFGLPKDTLVKTLPPVQIFQQAGGQNVVQSLGLSASLRDSQMNLRSPVDLDKVLALTPADVHGLPWWNSARKKRFYWDGWMSSAGEMHSADAMGIMLQFGGGNSGVPTITIANTGEQIRAAAQDLADSNAYHMNTATPKFPGPINSDLAKRGEEIFNNKALSNGVTCANCHGTYGGVKPSYKTLFFPPQEVGTDATRFKNMPQVYLDWYRGLPSQLAKPGADGQPVHVDVQQQRGYIAPPLNGIWAAAPYLHNGSVPSLRELLRPTERPAVWRLTDAPYDNARVGLSAERLTSLPAGLTDWARRRYYDTTNPAITGAANTGHEFGKTLNEDEVAALLEYLKTL